MGDIVFDFDETKTTQVIGVMAARCGGMFDWYLAMKALYALDREAIIRWGEPVIGGYYRMLQWGPVNQSAMDATRASRRFFADYFERSGNEIRMKEDPGTDELSRAEIRLTEAICDEWMDLNFNEAHRKAMSFPECIGLHPVVDIDPERMLAAAGRTPEQIEEVASSAREWHLLKHARGE